MIDRISSRLGSAPKEILPAREGALFAFAQTGPDDRGRGLVLLQLAPGTIAVVAVKDIAFLVNVNWRDNAA